MLQKNMQKKYDDLSKLLVYNFYAYYCLKIFIFFYYYRCDFNQYTMSYLKKVGVYKAKKTVSNDNLMETDEESGMSSMEEIEID